MPGQWTPVARRTVELEMGHTSGQMVDQVYGRVVAGRQQRLSAVAYPIEWFETLTEELRERRLTGCVEPPVELAGRVG